MRNVTLAAERGRMSRFAGVGLVHGGGMISPFVLLLAALVCSPVLALTASGISSKALAACVAPFMAADKYASAGQTAYNQCASERREWLDACRLSYTPPGFGFQDDAYRKCEFELRDITNALDRDADKSRPKEPPKRTAMSDAMEDLRAGRSLPGLPNLTIPVYLSKLSLVCPSPGAASNPNLEKLIITGTCVAFDHRIVVSVVLPMDAQSYINSHVAGTIEVVWRSNEMSVANRHRGWVRIDALSN